MCVFDTIINYDQKQIYTGKLELKSQWSVVIQSGVYSSSAGEHKKTCSIHNLVYITLDSRTRQVCAVFESLRT